MALAMSNQEYLVN